MHPASANIPPPAAAPAPPPSPRVARYRSWIIAGLALFLVWEVITRSYAAYLAEDYPEAALWLRASQPTALTKLADKALNPPPKPQSDQTAQPSARELSGAEDKRLENPAPKTKAAPNAQPAAEATANAEGPAPESKGAEQRPGEQGFLGPTANQTQEDLDKIKAQAELALRNDPLNARAVRVLGQLAQRQSNQEQADALMLAAVQRSRHESFAIYWTMLKSYREADYAATLYYADILLTSRNRLDPYVMPIVTKLAETPGAVDQLKQLLAKNPPWRERFFYALPNAITDARTPLDILLATKDSSPPPSAADLRGYLDFLIRHGFYDLAYFAWLQFLPPEQLSKVGRLFNGNFQTAPSGLPFDWVFKGGDGVNIQVTERPDLDRDNALLMEFGPGRVEFGGVSQLVLLPPGGYELHGKQRIDLVSQRGLQWRIFCGKNLVGESRPATGSKAAWEDFAVSFTVPEDCPVQRVALALDARSNSETFVSGSAWYDDLSITDAPATQTSTSSPEEP